MITKEIMAEKILRVINGGDINPASQVKKQDVYLQMETAYGIVVQQYLNIEGSDNAGEFVTVYPEVPILKDNARNKLYSMLPAQLVSLTKGQGIRQISGMKDEEGVFVPMNPGDVGLFYGLEASFMTGQRCYWLELDKIIYKNLEPYWENKSVMIKMIASIYSLPEDSYIPIPAGVEGIFEDEVLKRVMLQKTTPNHKLADDTDTNPAKSIYEK